MFSQLIKELLAKHDRYCTSARTMLGGEVFLTGKEALELLKLSSRTIQEDLTPKPRKSS